MQTPFDPQRLLQIHHSALSARALSSAFELDIFSPLSKGRKSAEEVAAVSGASARGVRMLLDGIAALAVIEKKDGRYGLLPGSARYLLPSSPDYIGAVLAGGQLWQSWGGLSEAVRSGRPALAVDKKERAESFFPLLIRTLHALNREPARRLAIALGAGTIHKGMRVLDLACGSAVWSLAIAEADREARVVAQDFPGVLEETRAYVAREGCAGRFDYLPGDLNEVSFGREKFDLTLLGNIVHSLGEGPARSLFARLHPALRPQGRLAIIDFIPDEDRTGPPAPVLFALNMLLQTEEGDSFTLSQYRAWLEDAGFEGIETAEIGEQGGMASPAIIARKG